MCSEKSLSQKFLVPNGLTKTLLQILEKTKCYHLFNVLPLEVREKLRMEGGSPSASKKMKIELTTTGYKCTVEFWYAFCKICQNS